LTDCTKNSLSEKGNESTASYDSDIKKDEPIPEPDIKGTDIPRPLFDKGPNWGFGEYKEFVLK
jgi:hypothetical protein